MDRRKMGHDGISYEKMGHFACNLRHLIKSKRIPYQVVAKEIGTTKQAVGRWCMGLNYPQKKNLKKLCEIFDVSESDLLGDFDFTGSPSRRIGRKGKISNICKCTSARVSLCPSCSKAVYSPKAKYPSYCTWCGRAIQWGENQC